MALKATIFKASLTVSDMDRHYYETHNLTLARHPSENDERMMLRLLAFGLNAHERLEFTKGLCADDEPELWQKDFSGDIAHWIDLGLPSEKRIRQACAKSQQVDILTYGGRAVDVWWEKTRHKVTRFSNLRILNIAEQYSQALAQLSERTMILNLCISDGEIHLSKGKESVIFKAEILFDPQNS